MKKFSDWGGKEAILVSRVGLLIAAAAIAAAYAFEYLKH
jgi:hypothetical protein